MRVKNPLLSHLSHDKGTVGGFTVIMTADISLDGRTDLYIIPRRHCYPQLYRDGILDSLVRPYTGTEDDSFKMLDHTKLG
ncbi:hypothetical protein AVEN_201126-1 [Araneus ventricosus]|uniref:Uncharacterized protein n=1 Tax=Araneus ventricosus TaxID=182803 RepID=A0A4Y2GBM8_ARAVE|nr:hypothetical protein AVEN_201126-1 [Araneus ventricosus]